MPEIKKYLNRDGLEEYNSLLPHSSGEMQEYVNDWLDAHPEATTTVQDGAITEPKLADKSVSLRTLADDTAHMLKGMILTREISGEVLTADDAYSAPPVALTVEGKSTQDGTPTPDAPVEIVSVENSVLTFAGRNLLPRTLYASTYNALDDGGYYVKSTSFAWSYANSCARVRLPAGTYTASAELISAETDNNAEIRVFDSANTQLARTHLNAGTSATFTLAEEIAIGIGIKLYATNNRAELQVQVGSAATAYHPHVTPATVTVPVTLRSLPDGTRDTLALTYLRPSTREGWAWYDRELVQRVGRRIIDGSVVYATSAATGSPDYTYAYTASWDSGVANIAPSNRCEQMACALVGSNTVVDTDTVSLGFAGVYKFRMLILASRLATPNEAGVRAYLNEHPLTIDYILATPITTQLDPIELPVLPAPNCTVWAGPTSGLQMEYVRDTNLVIQRIEEAIADQ